MLFIAKVYKADFIFNAPRYESSCTVRTPENIETMIEAIKINQSSFSTIEHFSHQFPSNIALSWYDILVQESKLYDHPFRFRFTRCANEKLHNVVVLTEIVFSNEAYFHLGGYVNKKNCHICGAYSPQTVLFT